MEEQNDEFFQFLLAKIQFQIVSHKLSYESVYSNTNSEMAVLLKIEKVFEDHSSSKLQAAAI